MGGSTKHELRARAAPQLCASQPQLRVSCCGGGPGAGKWGLESGPREGTAVGCEKTALKGQE